MSDEDDESYCDCADDLERYHRIEKAADGQFPENSDLAALFGTGVEPPPKEEEIRCSSNCVGAIVEEPSRCGRGGYRAVDNDGVEGVHFARRGLSSEGGYGPGQEGFAAGQGGAEMGQGGFGGGQGGYGAGQAGYGAGQGGYGAGQGGYGAGQGGYGAGQGYGSNREGFGGGQGLYGAGPGYETGKGIHRVGQNGAAIGVKGSAAGVAGDGVVGGVVGGSKRKTPSDVLIPIIGGGLVFLALITGFYRYFNVGTVVKSKMKTFTTQLMNILCDPKISSVVSGIGAGMGGAGKGAGKAADSGAGFAGGAGAGGGKACSESFAVGSQPPRKNDSVCGKERIHNSRRKYPLPPSPYQFPVIPGLHECTDDEENEEGVFVAPGPFD